MIAKASTRGIFLLGLALVCIDRFLKGFVFQESAVCNAGISFGVPISGNTLVLMMILVVSLMMFFLRRSFVSGNAWVVLGIIILFLGGLSNITDRILYGCVRDYIMIVSWFPWFNIADILIFFGGLSILFGLRDESEKNFRKILS